MRSINQKAKLLALYIILGLFLFPPVYALEISYPPLGGITISSGTTAAQYIVYFVNLLIAVGAFAAAVVLVMAGVSFASSSGDPSKIEEAKKRIRSAFLGLLILLGSYILLSTINSSLTSVNIDNLQSSQKQEPVVIKDSAGVYIYDGANYTGSKPPLITRDSKPFLNGGFTVAKSVKFVNPDSGYKYGAILFNDSDYRGDCSWTLSDVPSSDNISSIEVLKIVPSSASVTFYNRINCQSDTKDPDDKKKNICEVGGTNATRNIADACNNFVGGVVSFSVSGSTGVLLKTSDKDGAVRCQFFTKPVGGSCVNAIKYGYVYDANPLNPIKPKSFTLFSLYDENK